MRRGTLITGVVVGVLVVGSAVGATAAVVSLQEAQAETSKVGGAQLQAVSGATGEGSRVNQVVKPLVAPKLKVPPKKPPVVVARPVPVTAPAGSSGQGSQGTSNPDSWVSSDGQSGTSAPAGDQNGGGLSAGNSGSDTGGHGGEVEDSSNSSDSVEQEKPETPEPAESPETESSDDD
jgi:hypothetical protein